MPRKTATEAPAPSVTATFTMPPATPPIVPDEKEKPFFWERLATIPKEKWEKDIALWIYRLEPKVRMAPGERGYLDIITQAVTPMDIKRRWGGGRYRLMVLENNKLLFSTEEEIEGDPIYDKRREVVPDAVSNGGGGATMDGNVLKVLEQQNERLYQVLTTLQGAKEDNPAVAAGIEILTTAYKTGLSAVATQPGGATADPAKSLESVLALAERIVSVRGGGNSGTGSLTEAITLLERLGVFSKPKTLAEQLADLKAVNELIGGGGDEPKDWKAMGIKLVSERLPEILDALKPVPRAPGAPAPAAAPQIAPRTAAAPAAAPAAVSGIRVVSRDSNEAAAAAAPEAAAAPAQVSTEDYDAAMKVNVVNMYRQGASGSSIASFLEDVKPEFAADFLRYTPQQIRLWFQSDPILCMIVDDPRFDEVLEDARAFMADEEEPAPVPTSV